MVLRSVGEMFACAHTAENSGRRRRSDEGMFSRGM